MPIGVPVQVHWAISPNYIYIYIYIDVCKCKMGIWTRWVVAANSLTPSALEKQPGIEDLTSASMLALHW